MTRSLFCKNISKAKSPLHKDSERFNYNFLRVSKSRREVSTLGSLKATSGSGEQLTRFILTPDSGQTVLLLLMPTDDIAHYCPQLLANAEASYRKHFYTVGQTL